MSGLPFDDRDIEPLDELERAEGMAFDLHHISIVQSHDVAVVFDLETVPGEDKIGAVQQFLVACAEHTTARYLEHGHYDDPLKSDAALWFSLQDTFDGLSQIAPEQLRQRFYFVTANVADIYLWEFNDRASNYPACIGARVYDREDLFGRTIRFSAVPLTADPMRFPCVMRPTEPNNLMSY